MFGKKIQSFDSSQIAATDINKNEFVYNQVMANASAQYGPDNPVQVMKPIDQYGTIQSRNPLLTHS